MLEIKDLSVSVDKKNIIKNLNLSIQPGEIHAIMGPNGSGKSTLSKTIAGQTNHEIIEGDILFQENSILDWEIEKRSREGIFISFQHPVEIQGVSNMYFLQTAYNAIRKYNNLPKVNSANFLKQAKEITANLNMDYEFLKRSLNENFSGGEKKYNEILQLVMFNPFIAILDEIDSGVDIDSLKVIVNNIKQYKTKRKENTIVLITHYPRILDYIKPDYIHILIDGTIVDTGDLSIIKKLEAEGYNSFLSIAK